MDWMFFLAIQVSTMTNDRIFSQAAPARTTTHNKDMELR